MLSVARGTTGSSFPHYRKVGNSTLPLTTGLKGC